MPLDHPSKQEGQALLHAVEELYFFKDYVRALLVVDEASAAKGLSDELRGMLAEYRGRCVAKMSLQNSDTKIPN